MSSLRTQSPQSSIRDDSSINSPLTRVGIQRSSSYSQLKSSPAAPALSHLEPAVAVYSDHSSALSSVTDLASQPKSTIPRSESGLLNSISQAFNQQSSPGKTRSVSTNAKDSGVNERALVANSFKIFDEEAYNKNIYSSVKFMGTQYRFATESRNLEFHKIFGAAVPASDKLLDDFSCALSREFLYQGRLYITNGHICFTSKLPTWVSNLVIDFNGDIVFQKTATIGPFPNGIGIESNGTKHVFASFISRDSTFEFLETVKNVLESGEEFVRSDSQLSSQIEDALMSIDSDSKPPRVKKLNFEEPVQRTLVRNFIDGCGYTFSGIMTHPPTTHPASAIGENEFVLAEISLEAAPGAIFEIIFGANNQFVIELYKKQDSSDFSEFSAFKAGSDGLLEREYTYQKALNFPVGPKSTKCCVSDTIYHKSEDYINVVNTTRTPDVPSGGAFSVKTRYIMTWGPDNSTNLKVSFWVDWTGSSWIKGMVDKNAKSGQIAATEVLVTEIKKTVSEVIELQLVDAEEATQASPEPEPVVAVKTPVEPVPSEKTVQPQLSEVAQRPSVAPEYTTYAIIALLVLIVILLFANLVTQLRILKQMQTVYSPPLLSSGHFGS